jgi:peptidyl-prolyl cis-trans isomerase B (cyclophilin B)
MTRGVLAMASTGARKGGDSQMFILKKDADWLQGDYCGFGRVVEGIDIVDAIQQGDKIESMKQVVPTD